MSEPAIAGAGVAKRFGRAAALRGVDFEAPAAHCLAVLGPNGAGKSTLLRLVAGLARPSTGSIRVLGRAPNKPDTRARIGYMGHATLLYPTLTARENLLFAGRLYGVEGTEERADRLLDEEGLTSVAQHAAGDFSRGMAQRLAIARALMHDPSVLLLDEPFTGLDRHSALRLQARIGALRDEGRTLLLVSHDVEQAAAVANSAIVLVAGLVALATAGPPDPAAVERITTVAAG